MESPSYENKSFLHKLCVLLEQSHVLILLQRLCFCLKRVSRVPLVKVTLPSGVQSSTISDELPQSMDDVTLNPNRVWVLPVVEILRRFGSRRLLVLSEEMEQHLCIYIKV